MEYNNFNIKNISDYENDLKDLLKRIIEEQININNYNIKREKTNKIIDSINVGLLVASIIMPGQNIISALYFISLIIINKIISSVVKNNNERIKIALEEKKKNVNDKIDSLELLKSYLRYRNITTEEKIKIIENLYMVYSTDLQCIIDEIESDDIKLHLIYPNS